MSLQVATSYASHIGFAEGNLNKLRNTYCQEPHIEEFLVEVVLT